jgi:hypothetical protein
MNIYQKLNEVRKAVAYLRKEKEVTGAGTYKVVTHDQVTSALREHLIIHGIMVVPKLTKGTVANTGTTTAKGIPIIRYEAAYEIDFVNCEEPTDRVTIPIEAHALDQGDKAPGKAISYATKYAMLKLFSIETGEDEEDRPEVKAAKITPAAGIEDVVSPEDKERAWRIVGTVVDCIEAGMPEEGVKAIDEAKFDAETKIFMWKQLDSRMRSLLKKTAEAMKAKAKETADATV